METRQDELAGAAPAIVTPDPWEELRRFTDARIGLGHCGVSLPVKRWLEFRLAHARARDAVMTPLDEEQVRAGLAAHGLECLSLSSAVTDRNEYLTRPDKGRRLSVASRQLLDAWMDAHPGSAPDVSVVICDGLSARAVHENAVPFASRFLEEAAAAGLSAAPVALVKFGRVAVGDDVAALLNARLVVVLVGERPGLSSPDSLGVYMTHAPTPGLTDEARRGPARGGGRAQALLSGGECPCPAPVRCGSQGRRAARLSAVRGDAGIGIESRVLGYNY